MKEDTIEDIQETIFALREIFEKVDGHVDQHLLCYIVEAEDMLQNSFVVVFSKLNSFRGESTIGAWIKRIVVNNCINELKRKKLLTNEWDDSYMEYKEESAEHYDVEDVQRIKNAMQKLPNGYKQVFTLYALEGYDHQEIGSILGVSEATSKSQYSRAKKKIRDLLTQT